MSAQRNGLRLDEVRVTVDSVPDAAETFDRNLELPGRIESGVARVQIGATEIVLQAGAEGERAGMTGLVLGSSDLDALIARLEAAGVPFERNADGGLRIAGSVANGAPLEIRATQKT